MDDADYPVRGKGARRAEVMLKRVGVETSFALGEKIVNMEYTKLESCDLLVSRIGFGCEQLGGFDWGHVDAGDVVEAVHTALDRGVNFFDTADVYGLGRSEEMLAKALGPRRKDVVIATKFGVNWRTNRSRGRAVTFVDCSPRRVIEALEGSLQRLKIDCIPLYQIHWPDPKIPIGSTLDALRRCQKEGKIRYIGCSNFPLGVLAAAVQHGTVSSAQMLYSVIDRAAENDVLPFCKERNVSVLVYGALARGLLTGKYMPGAEFPANDRRSRLPMFTAGGLADKYLVIKRLQEAAARYEVTPAQVAIRWILENPMVSCAITGVKTSRQIVENVGALGWRLSREDRESIARVASPK